MSATETYNVLHDRAARPAFYRPEDAPVDYAAQLGDPGEFCLIYT